MNQTLSELNLREDFERVLTLPEASRWKLEMPAPLEVWATMYSAGAPDDLFQARLLWTIYPDRAPSLKFRDPATGRLDQPSAWPVLPGFRPSSLDACVNWCIEGLALHPEWASDVRYRWDSRGNVLLKVLRILQGELDEHFGGRYK
jgi:hypothetical protein